VGIQRLHAVGLESWSGASFSPAAKRGAHGVSAGARAAEADSNAATGSAGGEGIQRGHTGGVSSTRSKTGVNFSPAAKRGARGVLAGARAAEAGSKAATGSAGGEGLQRWLGGGHSPRADSAPGAGSLGASLQSMVSGQEEPVRMGLRLPAVCRGVRVLVSLPGCKGIRMRKPARPAGAGAGAAISCSALPKRSPYFSR
jgi:hypothetical protein